MPVTVSYPGIYIQELPSSAHTIAASPTSVAVFVGYSHPFKTSPQTFGKPIELFSFADYESWFGGFFSNTVYDSQSDKFGSLAHAVNQFFLNGGSDCYVIGLPAPTAVTAATLSMATAGSKIGVVFTAREPTDANHALTVTINNLDDAGDTADITLTYGSGPGSVFEKYRGVNLGTNADIETRIGTAAKPVSSLVTVQPPAAGGVYPSVFFGSSGPVTAASNAAPIVITSANHNLTTGQKVTIAGVGGNTAANGSFTITRVDGNSFSLTGSTGNAAFTTAGTWSIAGPSTASFPNAPLSGAVTAATNAAPVVITSTAHGLTTGQQVNIVGVGGTTAANGSFTITRIDANSFSLNGSTGNAAYTSGGGWTVALFSSSDFNNVFQANSHLDKVPAFNLLALPGVTDNGILSTASAFCERKMAFLIIDPLKSATADGSGGTTSIDSIVKGSSPPPLEKNCALYFPYLKTTDPVTGAAIEVPPSGTVAGIFARTDLNRGVWKAPAGLETTISNTLGVVDSGKMNDQRQGVLNLAGVNCLRDFPGIGTVVFGARTLVTNNPSLANLWRYVPVRRMALFLEQTLYANLGWVVFEPNDDPLWTAIRTSIESFMLGLFRQGAFQGSKPSEAFLVKCDSQTTSQDDINNGIVNIVVAFAPLKPAEFVIIKIAQLAGQAQT